MDEDIHQPRPPEENPEGEAPGAEEGLPAVSPTVEHPEEVSGSLVSRMPATLVLMMVILLIYGLGSFAHGFQVTDELVQELGAFHPQDIRAGQYWRFVTATLLHADLSHVFGNVVGLFIFGQLLEPWIGSVRMVLLFIVSALWGLMFSYYLVPVGTLGASTINYGEIGCYIALVLLMRYQADRALFMQELRSALVFTVLFVGWNILEMGTVNMWGHLGGFLGGLVFAYWVWEKRAQQNKNMLVF